MRLPSGLSASAVVCVRNEEHTIGAVLDQLKRLPLKEIIVVLNGCTDRSGERAAARGVTVMQLPDPLGHDVGRAVGARVATTDIVLFADGDFPIRAERLAPFLLAVYRGADVALNEIAPYIGPFRRWDAVTRAKVFLNTSLGRSDLGPASMTCVPHALSRRALETIGIPALAVPPAAQAAAILNGLTVRKAGAVNVIAANRRRSGNKGADNGMQRLILGDHLEAWSGALAVRGARLGRNDPQRRREAAAGSDGSAQGNAEGGGGVVG